MGFIVLNIISFEIYSLFIIKDRVIIQVFSASIYIWANDGTCLSKDSFLFNDPSDILVSMYLKEDFLELGHNCSNIKFIQK